MSTQQSAVYQTRVQDLVKHQGWRQARKTLYLRCLTGFGIRFLYIMKETSNTEL